MSYSAVGPGAERVSSIEQSQKYTGQMTDEKVVATDSAPHYVQGETEHPKHHPATDGPKKVQNAGQWGRDTVSGLYDKVLNAKQVLAKKLDYARRGKTWHEAEHDAKSATISSFFFGQPRARKLTSEGAEVLVKPAHENGMRLPSGNLLTGEWSVEHLAGIAVAALFVSRVLQ